MTWRAAPDTSKAFLVGRVADDVRHFRRPGPSTSTTMIAPGAPAIAALVGTGTRLLGKRRSEGGWRGGRALALLTPSHTAYKSYVLLKRLPIGNSPLAALAGADRRASRRRAGLLADGAPGLRALAAAWARVSLLDRSLFTNTACPAQLHRRVRPAEHVPAVASGGGRANCQTERTPWGAGIAGRARVRAVVVRPGPGRSG